MGGNKESFSFDRAYILHGCPPSEEMVTPKENRWMNWVASQLTNRGFTAIAPDMPISWQPQYLEWKREFEKYPVTENTLLIGHSCGGAFLVRWLLETDRKVKKLILVAPAKIPETQTDTRKDLYNFDLPEDGSRIANEIVIFISNDFPHHMKSFPMYKDSLHPRIIQLENKGHFLFFQMNTKEFPELLNEILS